MANESKAGGVKTTNCRTCKSYPGCDGCNVNTLIKALENGKFDFDEHHNVIIPDKVIHAKWKGKLANNGWKGKMIKWRNM